MLPKRVNSPTHQRFPIGSKPARRIRWNQSKGFARASRMQRLIPRLRARRIPPLELSIVLVDYQCLYGTFTKHLTHQELPEELEGWRTTDLPRRASLLIGSLLITSPRRVHGRSPEPAGLFLAALPHDKPLSPGNKMGRLISGESILCRAFPQRRMVLPSILGVVIHANSLYRRYLRTPRPHHR